MEVVAWAVSACNRRGDCCGNCASVDGVDEWQECGEN